MKYFTVQETADMLAVDVSTVRRWIQAGELEAFNCGRSVNSSKPRWRISEEALQRFQDSRSNWSPTPGTAPAERPRRRKPPKPTVEYW